MFLERESENLDQVDFSTKQKATYKMQVPIQASFRLKKIFLAKKKQKNIKCKKWKELNFYLNFSKSDAANGSPPKEQKMTSKFHSINESSIGVHKIIL